MWPEVGTLSGETSVKQESFEMFPEGCDRWAISYIERERVPESWCWWKFLKSLYGL